MKRIFLFIISLSLLVFSCKKDKFNNNIKSNDPFDLDPNKVSNSISFNELDYFGVLPFNINGDFSSLNYNNSIFLIQPVANQGIVIGSQLILPIKARNLDRVRGFYFKVDGASSYFNLANDFTLTDNSIFYIKINIELDGITSINGKFCISLCAYDVDNKISNIIKVCYNVVDYQNNNTNGFKLNGNWRMFREETYFSSDSVWQTTYYPRNSGYSLEYKYCDTIFQPSFVQKYNIHNYYDDIIAFDNVNALVEKKIHNYNELNKIPDNNCFLLSDNISDYYLVEFNTYRTYYSSYTYDMINNRVFLLGGKETLYNKNVTNNTILADNIIISNGSSGEFNFESAPIIVTLSSNEVRLDYTDYFGFVNFKQYLRKQ